SAFLSYRSGELRSRTSLLPLGLASRHSFGPALPSPGLREGGAERMPPPPPTPSARLPPLPVDLGRRPVVQGLVRTPLVVIGEVPPQPLLQLRHRLVPPQVDVLVLDRPPQPLHEHVVQAPPSPVHTHRHPRRLQPACPRLGRELHPLVGVEHLRPSQGQRLLQPVQAERVVQRIRQ